MNRNCKKYDISSFINIYPQFAKANTTFYIDEEEYSKIIDFLSEKKVISGEYKNLKKFYRILYEILNNRYNDDLYSKEEMSAKTKNITAMKFKGRKNIRLYCKEYSISGKKVVIVCLYKKKVQENDKKIKNLLESISEYKYEFS